MSRPIGHDQFSLFTAFLHRSRATAANRESHSGKYPRSRSTAAIPPPRGYRALAGVAERTLNKVPPGRATPACGIAPARKCSLTAWRTRGRRATSPQPRPRRGTILFGSFRQLTARFDCDRHLRAIVARRRRLVHKRINEIRQYLPVAVSILIEEHNPIKAIPTANHQRRRTGEQSRVPCVDPAPADIANRPAAPIPHGLLNCARRSGGARAGEYFADRGRLENMTACRNIQCGSEAAPDLRRTKSKHRGNPSTRGTKIRMALKPVRPAERCSCRHMAWPCSNKLPPGHGRAATYDRAACAGSSADAAPLPARTAGTAGL